MCSSCTSTRRKRARTAGFDIVYVYGSHCLPAAAVPDPVLQPPHRRVRRLASRTARASGVRRSSRSRRRSATTARSRCASRPTCSCGEAGTQLERDALPFVELVDHLVDVWDVNVSGIAEWGEDATPSRFYPQGRQLPWQAAVKSVSKKPVLGVGRFTNPDTMVEAINSGKLDIIGACRPSIADPFLPKKIDEGRLDDIRECIGCNICISRWEIGGPPLDLHAERDRRRGVPPRLAPGALRARRQRGERRAGRRRRPGRDGVRDGPRQARHAPRPSRRGAGRHGRDHALDPGAARARRVGASRQLPQDPARQAEERRVHPRDDARRSGGQGVRRRDRDRRDRRATGRPTGSTARRTTRSRAPTRACRTSSRPSRSWSTARRCRGAGS